MSEVYFIKFEQKNIENLKNAAEKISKLLEKFLKKEDNLGIKIHFGEEGNNYYISPDFVKYLYEKIKNKVKKADLIECNVLYKGQRTLASSHIKLAKEHGFDFAPIVITDGEKGDEDLIIEINKKNFKKIKVGKALSRYNSILCISHVKGHMGSGLGGALKNLGMGLGSRAGKLAMHSAFKLKVSLFKCTGCGICAENCPADAITINSKASIDYGKCIGCAKCIAVCPNNSIQIPWGAASTDDLQERFVEYCYGILKNRKSFYINYLLDISPDCDCMSHAKKPFTKNIGILFSDDIVAIEQASLDLIGKEKVIKTTGVNPEKQIEYAEKLGLGIRKYKLLEI